MNHTRFIITGILAFVALAWGYAEATTPAEDEVIANLAELEAQLAQYEQRESDGPSRAELQAALDACQAQVNALTASAE